MIATAAPLASCCATMLAAAAASSSRIAASPRCCSSSDDDAKLIADTYDWLDGFVIKHNLCPFASGVRSQTRTVVCRDDALDFVANEAKLLRAVDANQPATTLVCLPLFGEFELPAGVRILIPAAAHHEHRDGAGVSFFDVMLSVASIVTVHLIEAERCVMARVSKNDHRNRAFGVFHSEQRNIVINTSFRIRAVSVSGVRWKPAVHCKTGAGLLE